LIAYDTIAGAHQLNEELPLSLMNIAGMELGVDNWGKGKQKFGDGDTPPTPLWGPEGMGTYCARDVAYTHLIFENQRERVKADTEIASLMRYLVIPGLEQIAQMEVNGIWVDRGRVAIRRAEYVERQEGIKAEMLTHLPEDFRPTADFSNEHFLRRWIFGAPPDGLGMVPTSFTDKTRVPKVDEAALAEMNHPAIDLLRRYRKTIKAVQFFDQWIAFLDDDDRMHPFFNPTGTVTGRRSCGDPNLQQVPRDSNIRTCLGAPAGWRLLEVDFSALEVRVAAWFAEEDNLLAVFKRGEDVYTYTSSIIYKIPYSEVTDAQRQNAKAIVLGFIYGMSAKGFVRYAKDTFNVEFDMDEAERFRETFFQAYPALLRWHEKQKAAARKRLQVRSPLGRTRHLLRIISSELLDRLKAERQSINAPVQGFGGDLTLAAMVSMSGKLPEDEIKLVGDIHDALLFQVRDDVWQLWAHRVLSVMENPPALRRFNLSVPVRLKAEGKIGQYWGEGVKFSLDDFVSVGKISDSKLGEIERRASLPAGDSKHITWPAWN